MSEFESYHFQQLHGQLTDEEKAHAHTFSSRMRVTYQSAYVDYQYGGGGWDYKALLLRSFDCHLHFIGWLGGCIAFRFDQSTVDLEALRRYELKDVISVTQKNGSVILAVELLHQEYGRWPDKFQSGDNPFTTFYQQTQQGDYRWLYLCWVLAQASEWHDPEATNPPALEEMDQLTEVHHLLADFFQRDPDLIHATVSLAPELELEACFEPTEWTDHLSPKDQRHIIHSLLFSPQAAQSELLQLLREFHHRGMDLAGKETPAPTIEALQAHADQLAQARTDRNQQEKEQRKADYADAVRAQSAHLLKRVDQLIATKTPKGYDAAVRILRAFQQIIASEEDQQVLHRKTRTIIESNPRLIGLRTRLQEAGLCEGIPARPTYSLRDTCKDEETYDESIFLL